MIWISPRVALRREDSILASRIAATTQERAARLFLSVSLVAACQRRAFGNRRQEIEHATALSIVRSRTIPVAITSTTALHSVGRLCVTTLAVLAVATPGAQQRPADEQSEQPSFRTGIN